MKKRKFRSAGVPVAKFVEASTYEELEQRIDKVGFPCVVKTSRGGYDGKGQQIIHSKEQLSLAKSLFAHSACIAEAFVPFTKEISVIVQRNGNGRNVLPADW